MAVLYVKTPNGTTKSINLETMNIEYANNFIWTKFPNGILLQTGYVYSTSFVNNTAMIKWPLHTDSNKYLFIGAVVYGNLLYVSASMYYDTDTLEIKRSGNCTAHWMIVSKP